MENNCYIGVDIGGTTFSSGLFDNSRNLLEKSKKELISNYHNRDELLYAIADQIKSLIKVNNIFDEHVHRVNKRRKTTGAKSRESMLWREKGNFDLTHGFKDNKAMSARQNNNSKGGGKKIVKRNKKETKLNRDEIIAAYRKMKAAKNKQPRK